MEIAHSWWPALVFGVIPLCTWLLWSWNELRFLTPLKDQSSSSKVPPGHMGLPLVGELLTLIWYFKIVSRPDDFIKSKQRRVRSYLTNAINRPDALKKIAKRVQPLIVSALRSWADKGKVNAVQEVKKVTFENIGNIFVSFEPGPLLDMLDQYFTGLLGGVRALHLYIPGTAYYHAFQCRKKMMAIFRKELETRKQSSNVSEEKNDLMEGLMTMRDEEGKLLTDEEVLDNIASMVMAGYESTALSSVWALYFLAKYPDVLQKLREENMAVGRKGDFITSEELAQLKYTNKVVEETIRMANISPFVFRVANEDVNYKETCKAWDISSLWRGTKDMPRQQSG
ncbi:hypothetical protein IFM89_036443 [Coptis chinensis]|uniref:Uncharacterized protein n=1 Tax=Coptis chinensis TaxID=261450 RepID=A0A835LTE9_9MAGN|nr:hypothetical protein IFM89_036443 [Coptis chinensis]